MRGVFAISRLATSAETSTKFRRTALGFAPTTTEKTMTRLKLLGVAALVISSALASPVFAQKVLAQDAPRDHASKQMRMNPHHRHMAYRHNNTARNMAYRNDNNGWNGNQRDPNFWPGDVAAGVVGGALATAGAAVDTAGAIATAPFHGDSYAYDNSGNNNGWYDQGYAQRNGFVCQPGTWFRGEDGRQHPCQ
jgi:hypothetical protein